MTGTPLTALQFMSARAKAALWKAGVDTLECAVEMSDEELLALSGMGPSSLTHLRNWQSGLPEKPGVGAKDRGEFRQNVYRDFLLGGMKPEEAKAATDKAVAVFYGEETT